jgi:hypothetical protein
MRHAEEARTRFVSEERKKIYKIVNVSISNKQTSRGGKLNALH